MTTINAATGIQHLGRGYAAVIDGQQVAYHTGRGCQRRAIAAAGSRRLLTLKQWAPPTLVREDDHGGWEVLVNGRVSATYRGRDAKRRALRHGGPRAEVERRADRKTSKAPAPAAGEPASEDRALLSADHEPGIDVGLNAGEQANAPVHDTNAPATAASELELDLSGVHAV